MPVDIEVKMPDLAATESEITVLEWRVSVGESVERGETLLEVETDKATMEVEAAVSGVLKEILAQPDQRVEVGDVIAVVATDDGTFSGKEVSKDALQAAADDTTPVETPTEPAAPTRKPARGGFLARNRAKRADGIRSPERSKDGRGGTDSDVRVSASHRRAAERLQRSQQTVPHFYLQTSASAENLVARRSARGGVKTAWEAFFVWAAARAVKRYGRMAYRYDEGRLVRQPSKAVGVAVDVDDDLFVVPMADPGSQTPEEISEEFGGLVGRLRAGDPAARRIQPGWMTVSNLGVSGVESFAAIVNPPESAVLAIGKVARVPFVRGDEIVVEHRVNLTLAIDHRVVNGRYAAKFLNAIVQELETLDRDLT